MISRLTQHTASFDQSTLLPDDQKGLKNADSNQMINPTHPQSYRINYVNQPNILNLLIRIDNYG